MADQEQCRLLLVPAEIRQRIYHFLLDDGGKGWIPIRNKPILHSWDWRKVYTTRSKAYQSCLRPTLRSRYLVMERTSMFHERCGETTYYLADDGMHFDTAIMATCSLLYREASDMLYRKHSFDFGPDIQAVVPFLSDRTAPCLELVSAISVHKRGPLPCMGCTSDKSEWSYMCRHLAKTHTLKALRVVMDAGRPAQAWEGVQELSASDIKLLSLIDHEGVEWLKELAQIRTLAEVEIVPEEKHLPAPKSTGMAVYAALSASVEKGLKEFLRSEMVTSCIKSSAPLAIQAS